MSRIKDFLNSYQTKIDEKHINEKSTSIPAKSLIDTEKIGIIKILVSLLDLTTLEGSDTKEKVILMGQKAVNPLAEEAGFPHCAAVCVYPNLIKFAKKGVKGSDVKVASVATGFPSGQFPLKLKLADVKYCLQEGAKEIDMVISRGEF